MGPWGVEKLHATGTARLCGGHAFVHVSSVHVPLSHQTSLTKDRFKGKTGKNFKMVTAEPYTKPGPCGCHVALIFPARTSQGLWP